MEGERSGREENRRKDRRKGRKRKQWMERKNKDRQLDR